MKKTYFFTTSSSGNCSSFSSSGSCSQTTKRIVTRRIVNGQTVEEVVETSTTPGLPSSRTTLSHLKPQQISTIVEPKSEPEPKAESKPVKSSGGSSFEDLCLSEHNVYRKIHGSQPLTLDTSMCKYAREWAEYIASRNIMQHRSNNQYGENIFMASGSMVTGKDPVDSWYSEIKNYRFGSGGFAMNTGHFTQVVWKGSRKLGVGMAKRGHSTWVVANYDPPGNVTNQYRENVVPRQR